MERMRIMKKVLLAFSITWCLALAGVVHAQAPAPEPAAAAPAAAAAAAVPITDADIKNVPTPKPEDKAAGDPAGTITGTAGDIPVGDAKKGLTIGDVVERRRSEPDRDQLRVDARDGLPRHVHAGGLRGR